MCHELIKYEENLNVASSRERGRAYLGSSKGSWSPAVFEGFVFGGGKALRNAFRKTSQRPSSRGIADSGDDLMADFQRSLVA